MKKKLNKKTRTLMKLKKISKSTNNINGANDKNEKYFVPLTKYQPAMARAFRLALVTSPFATLSPAAFAQTLPSDYLFAITDGSAPNTVSYTTAGNYQTYTTSFTAQETGTNYVLFAFRNDPDYWTFGDVSLTAQGSSTNLLNNPYFLSGGAISDLNNLQAPAEWGVVYQNGTVPNAAGEWNAPTSSAGPSTPSIENSTAGSWYDGAVGSFDGIYQGINLVAGDSYTLSFTASSGEAADSSSVQLGVYTGSCVSLTSGTSCVPDNSGFAVSATPAEAANAGSPGVAMTTRQNAAGLASTPASILPVFDGGTLVLDGTPLTPYTFSITGNNGSIDLAGQSATISNPISDALVGTPGGLTITNSGSGGALTLSGANSYTGGTTIASGAGLNLSGSVAGAVANAGTLTLDGGAVGGTVTNNGALSVTANGGSVGSLTGSGAGTLNGNLTLTNAADTYAGALSGTGGLTLSGGSETLTGTNTYTGGTTINAGTLTGTTASFGSGAITNNGTLDISQNTDGILLNAVSGSGALVKDGSGTVTLAGPMSYTGGTVVNSGTLAMSGFPNVLSPGSMTVNGTLDVSGVLGGMPVTSLSGSGVVALGSRNLTLSHASGTFSGTITDGGIAGGTGGSLTLSDGTETLTGTNTYTGATAINGGTLALSGSGSIAASTGLLVSPVGTFDISGTTNGASVSGLTSFGTTALGGKTLTLTGMGTGTAGPPFSGPAMTLAGGVTATPQNMLIGAITDGGIAGGTGGGLTLASGSATGTVATILSTTGTYTGLTTIGSGTALIAGQGLGGSPISFASSSGVVDHGIFDISINGGVTFSADESTATFGAETTSVTSLSGDGIVSLGSQNLTLTGASGTFSGTITDDSLASQAVASSSACQSAFGSSTCVMTGGGSLTLAGGTETLSGTNTYTGGTTIASGAGLNLSGSVVGAVANAGTLTLDGGIVGGTVTDSGALTVTGNGGSAGSLAGNGTASLAGTLMLTNAADSFSGDASGTGGLTIAGGNETLTGANSYTGGTTIASGAGLNLSGSVAGAVANAGTLTLDGGIVGGTVTDSGALSVTANGGSAGSLAGSGAGTLNGNLTLTNASDTYAGALSGIGGLTLLGGTETLTGTNTYTGPTAINGGTLALSGSGSIAASTGLLVSPVGTFDISGTTNGASVSGLTSFGTTALGGKTLTLTGTAGSSDPVVTLAGGVMATLQNMLTGAITDGGIAGGTGGGLTLASGSATGTVATLLSATETYTGLTTIGSGTALIAAPTLGGTPTSFASSSGVVDHGIFDISINGGVTFSADRSTATFGAETTSVTSLSGDGIVSLGNQNLTLTGASGTFSGTITDDSLASRAVASSSACQNVFGPPTPTCAMTGGGSLTLAGGTETLSGTNTYTGGTTIASGAGLTLSGSVVGAVANAGTLTLDGGTVGGTVTDNGALTVTANGGSVGSLAGSGAGTLNGNLTLTNASDTYAGALSGIGGLTLAGGNETLSGANSYSGGTTIRSGTLTGTTASFGSGAIVDNGTLELSQDRDGTLANTVSGTGSLTKSGTGNVTLAAANSYTGGTRLADGTLTLTNESAIGTGTLNMAEGTRIVLAGSDLTLHNAIILNGDPTIDVASGTATLAGQISDGTAAGDIVKTGTGTLVLNGDSTYSRGTEIAGGTLQVDGNLVSPVVADSGATLSGTGSVGATTINSGATLSPAGNGSVGTLRVNGDLTLATGSNYVVSVNSAGAHDAVQVSGHVTLGQGTVTVLAADGAWNITQPNTIISAAGGASGTFGSVVSNFAFLNSAVTAGTGGIVVTLQRNGLDFSGVGTTRNQVATGEALDGVTSGALYNALVQTDAATARHALTALSGEIHASARTALIQDSYYVRDAAVERLRGAECAPGAASGMKTASGNGAGAACGAEQVSLWMQDYGSFGHNAGSANASGMGHSTGGFVLGADAPVLGWHVGGLVGYGHTSFDSGAVSSYGHSSNVSLGGYAGTHWGRLALRMGASYTWNMLSMTRNVGFMGFSDRLNTDYNGGTAQAFGDLGYRFDLGPAMVEPFANVAYVNLHTNGYTEHGGAAALAGRATDTGVTYSTFGARFASTFRVGAVALTPNATLGYRHAFGLTVPTLHQAFVTGGAAFDVAGVPLSTDAALLKAGLQAKLTDRLDVGVSYIGQYGDHSTDSGLTGNVKVKF